MIELIKDSNDNHEFHINIKKLILDKINSFKPNEVYIVKIDNWFDQKWLNFSGTIMHEVSIWEKDDVTIPPFHPNRVLNVLHYKNQNGILEKLTDNMKLHIYQMDSENLKRKISDICENGLFVWYSGKSEVNANGSIMIYSVKEKECFTYYISLTKNTNWKLNKTIGFDKKYINRILIEI